MKKGVIFASGFITGALTATISGFLAINYKVKSISLNEPIDISEEIMNDNNDTSSENKSTSEENPEVLNPSEGGESNVEER